ncbi:adenylate kinase [Blastococcus sp. KM273129]|uniref:adenylate kinase n=1 Tax=Blastococcus sp. KM273129 TaxID=2570315 RepID=UPI001F02BB63|nr:adenylate kinase [Blastococcus sp. KM273129]
MDTVRVVLLGPPGAGKGTQARQIADRLGVPAISTGQIFRTHVAEQTDLGRRVRPYLDAGEFVPDEVTIATVEDRLTRPDARAGFVLDGFPRTVRQGNALRTILTGMQTRLDCALELVVEEEEVIRRLANRRVTGDTAGGRRPNDQPDTIRHRLTVYREQTAPLTEYYEAEGVLVRIDASGPVDQVTQRVMTALQTAASRRSP